MAIARASGPDAAVLDLFEASARNVERATVLLRDLLAAWPEQPRLAADLVECEHAGDRIAHDIIHALHRGADRERVVALEGHRLATALDDIVDQAEHTADMLGVYAVEAPMEQAALLADVLVLAGEQVRLAVCALGAGGDTGACLVEIRRLENEADRISRDAIASLFAAGIDPMVVIRWKDIFRSLEATADACERVAHVLEGIRLEHRR